MRVNRGCQTWILLIGALTLLGSSPAWAQESGSITGTILDAEFQSALPGARVTLAGTLFVAYSNNDGVYTITGIPSGQYTVVIEVSGFRTEEFADLTVAKDQTLEQDAALTLVGFFEEVTVTATRGEIMLKDTPGNVTIITAGTIARTAGNTPSDYLDKIPGVDAGKTGAGIQRGITFLSINGYDDTYIRQMIDGVDVSNNVSNWGLIQEFPLELIETIDVVKGGSSSVWGSGMAGVVNIVTKKPQRGARPLVNLSTGFAGWGEMDFGEGNANGVSGGYGKGALTVSGMTGDLGYFLFGSYHSASGFVEHAKERVSKTGAKLDYELGPGESLSGFFNYSLSDSEGGRFWALFPGTDLFFWNYQDDWRLRTTLGTARYVNETRENLDFNFTAKASSYSMLVVRENLEDAFAGPKGDINSTEAGDRNYGFTAQTNYRFSDTGSLTAGFDYYNKAADFTSFGFTVLTQNEYAPYVNVTQRFGEALLVNAGLRYDGNDVFEGQLSPQFGVVINLADNTLIRGNAGRGYESPQLFRLMGTSFTGIQPNPDLVPERASLYSAGFETNEIPWLWLKGSVYLHKMTDGIIAAPRGDGFLQWENVSTFTRKGVEAEIGIQHKRGVFASLGYNYNRHLNTSGGVSQEVFWLPTRTWKASVGYANPGIGFTAFLSGKWIWYNQQGFVFDILQANDKKWVFDLKIGKDFRLGSTQTLTVHADLYNVGDTLFWERIDLPYAKRWLDFGLKLTVR